MKNLRKASMWNGWKKRELGKWLLLFAIESGISSSSSCECWFQSMMCAILCLKFNQMYFLIHLPCALLHSIHTQQQQKAPLFVRFSSFMQLIRFHIISHTITFFSFLWLCTFGACFYQFECEPCIQWVYEQEHTKITLLFGLSKINSHRFETQNTQRSFGCCFCVSIL